MIKDIQTAPPRTVGVGYKPQHYADILTHPPSLGWLEVHAETIWDQGGRPIAQLRALREHYAFSVHGVGLSIGSEQGIDPFSHLLSHAEHLFLRLMMDQSNLGDAAERTHQHDPHFNLSQILQTLLTNNAFEKVTQ